MIEIYFNYINIGLKKLDMHIFQGFKFLPTSFPYNFSVINHLVR